MRKYTTAFILLAMTLVGIDQIHAMTASKTKAPVAVKEISYQENSIQPVQNEQAEVVAEEPTESKVSEQPAIPVPTVKENKPVPAPAPKPAVKAAQTKPAPKPAPTPVAAGNPSNPAPIKINDVSAVPTLKYSDCTQSDFNSKFLCLINAYRAANGKSALKYNSTLNSVAKKYSTYMSTANFFGHVAPDGSHYYERCADMGISCHGENLAKGFTSAQNLFDMWRSSPAHNQNMLGPYTTMGLGITGSYATNVFRW